MDLRYRAGVLLCGPGEAAGRRAARAAAASAAEGRGDDEGWASGEAARRAAQATHRAAAVRKRRWVDGQRVPYVTCRE